MDRNTLRAASPTFLLTDRAAFGVGGGKAHAKSSWKPVRRWLESGFPRKRDFSAHPSPKEPAGLGCTETPASRACPRLLNLEPREERWERVPMLSARQEQLQAPTGSRGPPRALGTAAKARCGSLGARTRRPDPGTRPAPGAAGFHLPGHRQPR